MARGARLLELCRIRTPTVAATRNEPADKVSTWLNNYCTVDRETSFLAGTIPTLPLWFREPVSGNSWLSSAVGHFFAHHSLRKAAVACGAKFPENISSTRLRKHVATMIQLLNLREHELDAVATFMGHDVRVHRHFDRLQEDTVQLAKISKVLINMDQGKLTSMKNKNLDDITVDNEEDEVTEEGAEKEDVEVPCTATVESDALTNNNGDRTVEHHVRASDAMLPLKKRKSPGNNKKLPNSANVQNNVETKQLPPKKRETGDLRAKGKSKATTATSVRKHTVTKPRPWSAEGKKLIRNYFSGFITLRKTPQQAHVTEFLEKHGSSLNNRTWSDVKWSVRNAFPKK